MMNVASATVATAATTSDEVDLSNYDRHQPPVLIVPTMATATNISILVSDKSSGSYYQLYHPTINSATLATNQYLVSAGVGANGGAVPLPTGAFRFMKVVCAAAPANGAIFRVLCQ